jgi:hypothetical protein
MPGFNSLKQIVEASNKNTTYFTWRKTPSQATVANVWFDTALSPGNPPPNYYASSPGVGTVLAKSDQGGINHGQNVSPNTKHLSRFLILSASATGLPMPYILCDYLYYYPFIDQETSDQPLTNNTSLTRYADGKGVQVLCVSTNANTGTLPIITITYTNSDGVAGRISPPFVCLSSSVAGAILTSQTGSTANAFPFIPLQAGDSGVRSIQSVQVTGTPDVGLMCLVLVKPIITGVLLEQTAPHEWTALSDSQMPRIYDDACLNVLCLPQGSLSGVAFHGEIETIFN